MNTNNMQQTTFWAFLQKHKVEIPIIQRDYAQGRIGKEKLREQFLSDLKKSLDGELPNNEVLKLDFVYGSVLNDRLNPLDGQQRLTTLWLLHWYIAYKAGKLQENKNLFRRFSYETRTSSRDFCKKLSDLDVKQEGEIVMLIQKQTWFFSSWKQDPTIQAMLNMLGGTPIKDKDEEEILDGIEEVFINCDYSMYWEKLIGADCPILFYYLDLLDLTLSDDLYIKMNARGKSLTNFENFKADLVGFIKDKEFGKGQQPQETIAHKLDIQWTDIFWKYRSLKHNIDDIYFTFMNRYFLNSLLVARNENENYLYTQKEIESNKLFGFLYGESGFDSKITYNSFDIYKSEKGVFDEKYFERFRNTMDYFHDACHHLSKKDINSLFLPGWESNSSLQFIPDYVLDTERKADHTEPAYISSSITLAQRVVFFAICRYFEYSGYDKTSFSQWMRLVWNIVENANVVTILSMMGAMRLIDNLALYSRKIYEHLKDRDVSKDFANDQMVEEKEKACQIIGNIAWKDPSGKTWEDKISEAEKTAFFKGSIRFLYRDEMLAVDWAKFDSRFGKAQLYFDEKGVTPVFRKDARLICTLISLFTKWEQCYGGKKIIIGNGIEVWSYIVKNDNLLQPLIGLLELDAIPSDIINFSSQVANFDVGFEETERIAHEDMCNNGLISEAIIIMGEGIILNWKNGLFALYKPNANADWKKYVIGTKRNKIIYELRKKGILLSDQNISGKPYFWGWDIIFTIPGKTKKYQWRSSLKEQQENSEWEDIPTVNLGNLEDYLKDVKEIIS